MQTKFKVNNYNNSYYKKIYKIKKLMNIVNNDVKNVKKK